MLALDEVVIASVEHVMYFGVILRKYDSKILVLATETAPTAAQQRAAMAGFVEGQEVQVKILKYVQDEKIYVGSIRAIQVPQIECTKND
jgi:hypothetical protein